MDLTNDGNKKYDVYLGVYDLKVDVNKVREMFRRYH